jgi:hypothetical protein
MPDPHRPVLAARVNLCMPLRLKLKFVTAWLGSENNAMPGSIISATAIDHHVALVTNEEKVGRASFECCDESRGIAL